ncbi:MAG: phosphotransferase [Anaerolineaceae bacterium]|nr:phosphotransferase [Anaerolineaceae bacterium]
MIIEADLSALISQEYPFTFQHVIKTLPTKGKRASMLLETNLGLYVVKISDPGRDEEIIQSDTGILAFLGGYDFPAPQLLRTQNGERYLAYKDAFVYLYGFLDGKPPKPCNALFEKIGHILARLHSLSAGVFGRDSSYTPEGIIEEMYAYSIRARSTDQAVLAGEILNRLDRLPSFSSLPRGLIHTDPYLDNWLESSRGELTLIDWDDAGIGVPLLDVGYAVANLSTYPVHEAQRWGVPVTGEITFREDWARIFLKAYEEVRPLSVLERELLPAAMQLSIYFWDWDTKRLIEDSFARLKILEQNFKIGSES